MRGIKWDKLLSIEETKNLAETVRKFANKGNMAEVGVFEGDSAEVICENKGTSKLYLFDTFEGIPDMLSLPRDEKFKVGQFKADFSKVSKRLNYPNIFILKGLFPSDTGDIIDSLKFSFVHIDVDIYKSAKDSLMFFLPKMEDDGIIILHDFGNTGVDVALAEVEKIYDFKTKLKKPSQIFISGVRKK